MVWTVGTIPMEAHTSIKYFQPIEMNNAERLEVSALMDGLKEANVITENLNLGQFVAECYTRGLNEYRKDLYRKD